MSSPTMELYFRNKNPNENRRCLIRSRLLIKVPISTNMDFQITDVKVIYILKDFHLTSESILVCVCVGVWVCIYCNKQGEYL